MENSFFNFEEEQPAMTTKSATLRQTEQATLQARQDSKTDSCTDGSDSSIHNFVLCQHHGLNNDLFCFDCEDDICSKCRKDKHGLHEVYKSMTCDYMLNRSKTIQKMGQQNVSILRKQFARANCFLNSLLLGPIIDCLNTSEYSKDRLDRLRVDFESHLQQLGSIIEDITRCTETFPRMMQRLRQLKNGEFLIEMHNYANYVRCKLIELHRANMRSKNAVTNASSSIINGHHTLAEIIKSSEIGILTIVSISSLFKSSVNQEQMAQFGAVNQVLPSEYLTWPEVNHWEPSTPQPQHPHFAAQFSASSMLRSQSAITRWEQKQQPRTSVPWHVPSVQQQLQAQADNGRVFDIGNITRDYSLINKPVLILEGQSKNDPATLCRPWGICWDKNNNKIYVADRSHDRIAVYSAEGRFLYAFGNNGAGPGEFNRPAGLAIDFEGRLVVADKDNHRIQVFKPNGEYLFFFGKYGNDHGQFFYPWDVACSSNGHIAVTDTNNRRVQIFTSSGSFIKKFGWENGPSILKELDQPSQPRGVIFLESNVLLVTDFNNHRIMKIVFGDRVYMDHFNDELNPQSFMNRPQGLALDAKGNVLVCDSKNYRIMVFESNGKFLGEFGKRGKEAGQFDRPVDISVAPDGRIAVVDMDNARVQIF